MLALSLLLQVERNVMVKEQHSIITTKAVMVKMIMARAPTRRTALSILGTKVMSLRELG